MHYFVIEGPMLRRGGGVVHFWSKTKVVESRAQWDGVPVPALDSMAIWAREGSMICCGARGAGEDMERGWAGG
jgi:hypothetical protein